MCSSAGTVSYNRSSQEAVCDCDSPETGAAGPTCTEFTNAKTCSGNGVIYASAPATAYPLKLGTADPFAAWSSLALGVDFHCNCSAGWVGQACNYSDATTCNDAGTALYNGSCSCKSPVYGVGPSCEFSNDKTCSGKGRALPNGRCVCFDKATGWGPTCSEFSNSATCNGAGEVSWGYDSVDESCSCSIAEDLTSKEIVVRSLDGQTPLGLKDKPERGGAVRANVAGARCQWASARTCCPGSRAGTALLFEDRKNADDQGVACDAQANGGFQKSPVSVEGHGLCSCEAVGGQGYMFHRTLGCISEPGESDAKAVFRILHWTVAGAAFAYIWLAGYSSARPWKENFLIGVVTVFGGLVGAFIAGSDFEALAAIGALAGATLAYIGCVLFYLVQSGCKLTKSLPGARGKLMWLLMQGILGLLPAITAAVLRAAVGGAQPDDYVAAVSLLGGALGLIVVLVSVREKRWPWVWEVPNRTSDVRVDKFIKRHRSVGNIGMKRHGSIQEKKDLKELQFQPGDEQASCCIGIGAKDLKSLPCGAVDDGDDSSAVSTGEAAPWVGHCCLPLVWCFCSKEPRCSDKCQASLWPPWRCCLPCFWECRVGPGLFSFRFTAPHNDVLLVMVALFNVVTDWFFYLGPLGGTLTDRGELGGTDNAFAATPEFQGNVRRMRDWALAACWIGTLGLIPDLLLHHYHFIHIVKAGSTANDEEKFRGIQPLKLSVPPASFKTPDILRLDVSAWLERVLLDDYELCFDQLAEFSPSTSLATFRIWTEVENPNVLCVERRDTAATHGWDFAFEVPWEIKLKSPIARQTRNWRKYDKERGWTRCWPNWSGFNGKSYLDAKADREHAKMAGDGYDVAFKAPQTFSRVALIWLHLGLMAILIVFEDLPMIVIQSLYDQHADTTYRAEDLLLDRNCILDESFDASLAAAAGFPNSTDQLQGLVVDQRCTGEESTDEVIVAKGSLYSSALGLLVEFISFVVAFKRLRCGYDTVCCASNDTESAQSVAEQAQPAGSLGMVGRGVAIVPHPGPSGTAPRRMLSLHSVETVELELQPPIEMTLDGSSRHGVFVINFPAAGELARSGRVAKGMRIDQINHQMVHGLTPADVRKKLRAKTKVTHIRFEQDPGNFTTWQHGIAPHHGLVARQPLAAPVAPAPEVGQGHASRPLRIAGTGGQHQGPLVSPNRDYIEMHLDSSELRVKGTAEHGVFVIKVSEALKRTSRGKLGSGELRVDAVDGKRMEGLGGAAVRRALHQTARGGRRGGKVCLVRLVPDQVGYKRMLDARDHRKGGAASKARAQGSSNRGATAATSWTTHTNPIFAAAVGAFDGTRNEGDLDTDVGNTGAGGYLDVDVVDAYGFGGGQVDDGDDELGNS